MQRDSGQFGKLGPATTNCRRCLQSFDESYYSMWSDKTAETYGTTEWFNSQPICNTCRTYQSGQTGYLAKSTEWTEKAACAGIGEREQALFFPLHADDADSRLWAGYCDFCPVLQECLEFGRQTGSVGVWGGEDLTPRSRRDVKLNRCRSGRHAMTPRNTVIKSGHRTCKACYEETYKAYNAKMWADYSRTESVEQRELRLQGQRDRDAKRPRAQNIKPRFRLAVGETCKNGGHLIESESDMRSWVNARGVQCFQCRKCHNVSVQAFRARKREAANG